MAARSARSSTTRRLLYSFYTTSLNPAPQTSTAALLTGNFHLRYFSAGSAAAARLRDEKEAWWKESLQKLRNIGISAHIDSGKTTLTERVLYYTGRIHEIHEVRGKDGVGAKMDSMDLEREKGITIQSAATYCNWKDYQVNIIDTPGHVDFTIEVERALRVLDGAILVLCSVGGVQSQSITVDRQMRRYEVPRLAFINKLDRMGADPWKVMNQARSKLRHHSAAVQIPIGLEDDFKGLVDLVNMKAYYFHGSSGEEVVTEDVPADHEALAIEKRRELVEVVSEVDDKLAEAFLSDEPISPADLEGVQPLLDGVLSYLPCPTEVSNYALDQSKNEEKVTLSGSPDGPLVALAFKLEEGRFGQLTYLRIYEGVIKKGDFIVNVNTGKKVKVTIELVAVSFKRKWRTFNKSSCWTNSLYLVLIVLQGIHLRMGQLVYTMTSMSVPEPVMSLAISAVSKDSGGNFSKALNRFQKEDPTFRVGLDPESGQTIISGMGELHLDIYVERMRRELMLLLESLVSNFRETITQRAEFDYLHKKQSGGQGQYGRVIGYVEPLPPGSGTKFEFDNMLVGQAIPPNFVPAIEKGFKEAVNSGSLIGHPVENVRIVLTDGASHAVDSSELAFKLAAIYAFRQCYTAAKPVILEPVMLVELKFPTEFQGSVTGDINKRKGMIVGNDQEGDDCVITAHVPLNNMFGYSTALRSMTQGKGEFTMEYLEHSQVSQDVQTQLDGMDESMKHFHQGLIEVEIEAEDLLLARHELVEIDRVRNGNREALTALRKRAKTTNTSVPSPFESIMRDVDPRPLVKEVCATCGDHTSREKTLLMFPGTDVFAAIPFHAAHTILEKDQARLDFDSKKLQSYVKEKSFSISEKGVLADKISPGVLRSLVTLTDKAKNEEKD
ncbi:UNVERIFIED_CONTAM: Elongation factor G-2, mitochondrial [Sesamum angustifolium]|uniref:Elongation factor G, mitochondrial n=1 Tax=Sesamum angustifolium TaxID=2727405 RepID=A0AAW2RI81_9LAMI